MNLNLLIATATASCVGLGIAYLLGSWPGAWIALIVGAGSYFGVMLVELVRKWVWFRK